MRKITFLLVFLLLVGVNFAFAQSRTITGKITSSQDGMGIPGATVLVKGTTIGTTTTIDGEYEITVQPNHRTLVFWYVGMTTQEITFFFFFFFFFFFGTRCVANGRGCCNSTWYF